MDLHSQGGTGVNKIEEKSLKQMESLLHHSTQGVHILFDNKQIADVLKDPNGYQDLLNQDKMKRVQEVLVQLISKKSYSEKMAYLNDLDKESYEILVRTYFNIVENTIKNLDGRLQH